MVASIKLDGTLLRGIFQVRLNRFLALVEVKNDLSVRIGGELILGNEFLSEVLKVVYFMLSSIDHTVVVILTIGLSQVHSSVRDGGANEFRERLW